MAELKKHTDKSAMLMIHISLFIEGKYGPMEFNFTFVFSATFCFIQCHIKTIKQIPVYSPDTL